MLQNYVQIYKPINDRQILTPLSWNLLPLELRTYDILLYSGLKLLEEYIDEVT